MAVFSRREGEITVDHSASPGLPEEVARAAGYDPAFCGEGQVYRQATVTCSHCRVVVVKNPLRTRARESCSKCGNHYICDWCAADARKPDYDHMPFEKLVDICLTQNVRAAPYGVTQMGSEPKLILPPAPLRETA